MLKRSIWIFGWLILTVLIIFSCTDQFHRTYSKDHQPIIVVTDYDLEGYGIDHVVSFGSVTALSSSPTQSVRISNSGNADLLISEITGTNTLTDPFSITLNDCSPFPKLIPPDCTLTVTFAPKSSGTFTDSFEILSDDPNPLRSSITVTVTGTGI